MAKNAAKVKLPKMCLEDADPDRYELFAILRELWYKQGVELEEKTKRTNAELARRLGVNAQNTSQWASGSAGKSPAPWFIIMTLCHWLELFIAIKPDGVQLYSQKG